MTHMAPLPRYVPDSSAMDAPPWRELIMPAIKSWTAPPSMDPNTIQRNTTGPNTAPMRAPKMGPVPAMFKSWIKNARPVFRGTQSTPSCMATAGVSRSSGANTVSATRPYTA